MTTRTVPGDSLIWLDGVRVSSLPLPDRGLEFGDGLFETLLIRGAQPLFLHLHLARLLQGCTALGFPDCDDAVRVHLQGACGEIETRGWAWTAVRVTLTRGAGPRGYAPPQRPTPRIIISATALAHSSQDMPAPAAVMLSSVRWPSQPMLAGLKHLTRLEQVLAAREYRDAGHDEAVMQDQQGRPVSVVAGNLFLVCDGRILTAPLVDCGIAGTRRYLIMEYWAPALGLAVDEVDLSMARLETAQEVFYSNSLLGLRPVSALGPHRWSSHPVCEALYQQYRGALT
mgnify:FL=1